jgi:hypothetical protein
MAGIAFVAARLFRHLRGLFLFANSTHGLRPFDKLRAGRGLHSSAAPRLSAGLLTHYSHFSLQIVAAGVKSSECRILKILLHENIIRIVGRNREDGDGVIRQRRDEGEQNSGL